MLTTLETPPIAATDPQSRNEPLFIKWFADTASKTCRSSAAKMRHWSEMYSTLTSEGVKVPNDFSMTAEAYRYFLRETASVGARRT